MMFGRTLSVGYDNPCGRRCAECGYDRYIVDWSAGDVLCPNCGLVHEGHCIDDRPEWRNFADSGLDKSRCGEAVNEKKMDSKRTVLATVISQKNTYKKNPAPSNSPSYVAVGPVAAQRRLVQVHNMTVSGAKDRTLSAETEVMDGCMQSQGFNLSDIVRETAIELYVDIRKKKRVKRDMQPGVMALCAMLASRTAAPRTMTEVCTAFNTTKTMVAAARKDMKKVMKEDDALKRAYGKILSARGGDTTDAMTRIVNIVLMPDEGECVDRSESRRRARFQVVKRCRELDEFAKKHGLVGSNDPERFALAIVLVTCQDMGIAHVEESTFVSHFKISLNTLQKHARTLRAASRAVAAEDDLNKNTPPPPVVPPPVPPPECVPVVPTTPVKVTNTPHIEENVARVTRTPDTPCRPSLPCPSPIVSFQRRTRCRVGGGTATACESPMKRD